MLYILLYETINHQTNRLCQSSPPPLLIQANGPNTQYKKLHQWNQLATLRELNLEPWKKVGKIGDRNRIQRQEQNQRISRSVRVSQPTGLEVKSKKNFGSKRKILLKVKIKKNIILNLFFRLLLRNSFYLEKHNSFSWLISPHSIKCFSETT